MFRRIWDKHDASILLGVIVLAIGLAVAYLVLNSRAPKTTECSPDVVYLSGPLNSARVLDALTILEEGGIVPSVEAARDSLEDAQYVFDPGEDYEIEYWLFFEGDQIAQFNIGCPKDEETNLEYEGVR